MSNPVEEVTNFAGDLIKDPIGTFTGATLDLATGGAYTADKKGKEEAEKAKKLAEDQKKAQEGILAKEQAAKDQAVEQDKAVQTNSARLAAFKRRQQSRRSKGFLDNASTTIGGAPGSKNLLGL